VGREVSLSAAVIAGYEQKLSIFFDKMYTFVSKFLLFRSFLILKTYYKLRNCVNLEIKLFPPAYILRENPIKRGKTEVI
jgi:hypothetical protein